MSPRAPQIFFVSGSLFFSLLISLAADLVIGEKYSFNFTDVDGQAFSTADNHVTLVLLTTITDVAKARAVGDRVPDRCLGDPTYRMISVLPFSLHWCGGDSILKRAGCKNVTTSSRFAATRAVMFLPSPILMARSPHNSARNPEPASFASSSSVATANCCNNGVMFRARKNWIKR